jgi:hypothetical protein
MAILLLSQNAKPAKTAVQPALDVALGVRNGLAVLAPEQLGELVIVVLRELQDELQPVRNSSKEENGRPRLSAAGRQVKRPR